jgi:uncharacterized membrane protein
MATRKRAASAAQQDLAEAKRRAKAARTPIAKAVTKRVVEAKERTYSGQAAREASAQMRRGVHPVAVGTKPKGSTPARKAAPKQR